MKILGSNVRSKLMAESCIKWQRLPSPAIQGEAAWVGGSLVLGGGTRARGSQWQYSCGGARWCVSCVWPSGVWRCSARDMTPCGGAARDVAHDLLYARPAGHGRTALSDYRALNMF